MKRIFFYMAAVLLVQATEIYAENLRGTEQTPYILNDSVAVTANRTSTPLHEIASSITVISKEEIEKSQSVFVTHLLRNVPGVDVVQSGGVGKFTSVFIRGSNAHHALVLLDGIPLNDPSSPNNAADLSNLTTGNIERIEILRGAQSVLYGPEAIGGVVQIFTKAGGNKSNVSVTSEGGSYGSYSVGGVVSGLHRKLGYSASAERLKTNGISSAAGASERDGYENISLSSRLDFKLNESLRLNFVGRYTDLNSELDKTGGILDDPDFSTSQREQQYQALIVRQTPDSKWHQKFAVYFGDVERTTFDDFDMAHLSDSEFTTSTGQRLGANFVQSISVSDKNNIAIGVETEKVAFTSDLFFRSSFGDYADTVSEKSSWTRGIYLLDQIQFYDKLFLTFGGRLDEHKQFGTTGTYRITAAYLFDKSGTRLRGVIGSGYKAPSVFQLYHPSPYIGNPNLNPEKSRSWELGLDQEVRKGLLTLSLTYFDSDFDDLIVGIENVDKATSDGVEAAIQLQTKDLRSRLDYTYCDSKDISTNAKLIRRPNHKLTLSTAYKFSEKMLVNVTARFTGKREDLDFRQFPASRVYLKKYSVFNLGASYEFTNNIKFNARIENLLDEEYQEVYLFGSLPRSFFIGVKFSN